MADLVEANNWDVGIYQLETVDPVEGGPGGIDNRQAQALANRTKYLKAQQEAHAAAVDPHPQYMTTTESDAAIAAAVSALVASSPAALDTLAEFATALGNDPNFATTITNLLAAKAAINSPVFTGTPSGPTPAQFDITTKLATMAAVQRSLGNFAKFDRILTAATALTAADIGSAILVGNTINYTVTLPNLADVPTGASIYIQQTNTGLKTIAGAGADTLGCGTASGIASINLQQGDSVALAKNDTGGAPRWQIVGGSAVLRYSNGDFVSGLSASGYQKLPSGLIIQWTTKVLSVTANVDSGDVAYTLPIAFPSAHLQTIGSIKSMTANNIYSTRFANSSLSQATVGCLSTQTQNITFASISIGY